MYTWGESDHGKLGLTDGLLAFHRHPQEVMLPEKVVQVAAGSAHTLFLTGKSLVFLWCKNIILNYLLISLIVQRKNFCIATNVWVIGKFMMKLWILL